MCVYVCLREREYVCVCMCACVEVRSKKYEEGRGKEEAINKEKGIKRRVMDNKGEENDKKARGMDDECSGSRKEGY